MTIRRGMGTIEPQPDGTYRPRLPSKGARLSACASREEARRVLDAALYELQEGASVMPDGITLATFGEGFLARREKTHADAGSDRSLWRTCIATASIAPWPLRSIGPVDVRHLRDELLVRKALPGHGQKAPARRTISRSRVQNALNLLRVCLAEAVEKGLVDSNPARDVRLPRAIGRTHEPWTYLLPEEQGRLVTCPEIDEESRDLYAFALGCGMRESEIWNLHLVDVLLAERVVIVRFGGRGKCTKGKRIRRVQLFGLALGAVERQLERLQGRHNPHRLLWPSVRGERRPDGKMPPRWYDHLDAAGIIAAQRHDGQLPRFHDLRHSCASSLIAGWWGRRWSMHEAKELLGHRSVTTTERYAHLAVSVLETAAKGTSGPTFSTAEIYPGSTQTPRRSPAVSARDHSAPPARIGLATFGLGNRCSIH